jgi:enediyne biosynthesis protein E4
VTARARLAALTLLALALPGCGEDAPAPAAVPAADAAGVPWFQEEAAARGLVFQQRSGHAGRFLYPEIMCGGAALFDMEQDGDLDAFLVQAGGVVTPSAERPPDQLFENDGSGRFRDVTDGSGAGDRGYGMGVTTGDADGDGDTDLYVTNLEENALLANDGHGRFQDVTLAAGAGQRRWSTSAAFFDAERDGDLDLFVVNYIAWTLESERVCYAAPHGEGYCGPHAYASPVPSTFFRNEGDGRFVDRSSEAGMLVAFGNGLGVGILDQNDDGWLDVFVANDGTRNQLWINVKDGTFADRALALGCAVDQDGQVKAGMGVGVADLDDDGDEDLLVVNLTNESDSLFLNQQDFFADRTALVGLTRLSQRFTRFGAGFQDFDADGWLDLFQANGRVSNGPESEGPDPFAEPNLLYRGRPGEGAVPLRFEEVLPRGGTRPALVATSRAAAFGDVDGDGGVDVLVVNKDGPAHLLMNRVPERGQWIRLRVVGEHGGDALGARVSLRLGERVLTRRVRTDTSYCAANDPRVHVGLGTAQSVEEVTVRWLDGREESYGPFAAGRDWTLVRGQGRAR